MEVYPVDPARPEPPYEQVRAQLASRAASGDLPAGTRLPTVRALAGALGVAVNTVARAYKELEADGVITTEGRRGTFIASATDTTRARDAAASYAATARRQGLTLAEALNLVERSW